MNALSVLQNTMYEISPAIDEMKCDKSKLSDSNSLMGHDQADSNSPRGLQADDDKPHLGFVSWSTHPSSLHPLLLQPSSCYMPCINDCTDGNMQLLNKRCG